MAHHVIKEDIIRVVRGKLVYSIYGKWKKNKIEIYRETLDGDYYADCEESYSMGGYLYSFKGEIRSGYYYVCGEVIQKNKLVRSCKHNHYIWNTKTYPSKENIIKVNPSAKYLCAKTEYQNGHSISVRELWDLYKIWLKHPECEALAEMRLYNLAMNEKTYSLKNKKQFINWIKSNACDKYTTLSEVKTRMKYGLSEVEYATYNKVKRIGVEDKIAVVKYLSRQADKYIYTTNLTKNYFIDNLTRTYCDYILTVKNINETGYANHDLSQDYWKYPSNLQEAESKVRRELARIENAEQRKMKADEEKKFKENKVIFKKLFKKTLKLINGYTIYTPYDVEDVENQAVELNQCLIQCGYDKKMLIDKSTILVFIKQNETPIATAEINFDKKILQFYANEEDHDNCTPDKEVQSALNQWLGMVNINKQMLYTQ